MSDSLICVSMIFEIGQEVSSCMCTPNWAVSFTGVCDGKVEGYELHDIECPTVTEDGLCHTELTLDGEYCAFCGALNGGDDV